MANPLVVYMEKKPKNPHVMYFWVFIVAVGYSLLQQHTYSLEQGFW